MIENPLSVSEDSEIITTGAGTSIAINVKKVGRMVSIRFGNGSYTASADATLFTISAKFCPIMTIDFLETYGKKRIFIAEDGKVTCNEALSNTPIRGTITYISAS